MPLYVLSRRRAGADVLIGVFDDQDRARRVRRVYGSDGSTIDASVVEANELQTAPPAEVVREWFVVYRVLATVGGNQIDVIASEPRDLDGVIPPGLDTVQWRQHKANEARCLLCTSAANLAGVRTALDPVVNAALSSLPPLTSA